MIRVLGFALYGPLAASTRYRLLQYQPGLRGHGVELEVASLLGDRYLQRRFEGGSLPLGEMLGAARARLRQLHAGEYDLAIVHCELFPMLPGLIERSLLARRPFIYDFDDAFQLKYRTGKWKFLSPLLGGKFETVLSAAAAVTAGNAELRRHAAACNREVVQLPTVVDTGRYRAVERARIPGEPFTVGWIGSPSTAPFLQSLVVPLATLGREAPVRLVVVGGKAPAIPGVEVIEHRWQESTELGLIRQFDVGVMPQPDTQWTRGKCAFKLIQYMACGVPVVGSRVGANIDVVAPGSGFLADSDEGWLEALRALRDDDALAKSMGAAGRAHIESGYSLAHNLPVLADLIRSVARGDAR